MKIPSWPYWESHCYWQPWSPSCWRVFWFQRACSACRYCAYHWHGAMTWHRLDSYDAYSHWFHSFREKLSEKRYAA